MIAKTFHDCTPWKGASAARHAESAEHDGDRGVYHAAMETPVYFPDRGWIVRVYAFPPATPLHDAAAAAMREAWMPVRFCAMCGADLYRIKEPSPDLKIECDPALTENVVDDADHAYDNLPQLIETSPNVVPEPKPQTRPLREALNSLRRRRQRPEGREDQPNA